MNYLKLKLNNELLKRRGKERGEERTRREEMEEGKGGKESGGEGYTVDYRVLRIKSYAKSVHKYYCIKWTDKQILSPKYLFECSYLNQGWAQI